MALREPFLTRIMADRPRNPAHAPLVVTRYGLMEVFNSRVFLAFYVLCLIPSLSALIAIYLSHNTALLEQIPGIQEWAAKVPAWIFPRLFGWQAMPAFLIAVIAAPPLIAADLAHNAITVILSRPISRTEYILGKIGILIVVLSPITWIPGVAACLLHAILEPGGGWFVDNLRIPAAYFAVHWVWILVLSIFGLAVSSTVRYTALARGLMLALVVIGSGSGAILNQLTRTAFGDLLRLPRSIEAVFMNMTGAASPSHLPAILSWAPLVALATVSLWILNRKLRACEEVA